MRSHDGVGNRNENIKKLLDKKNRFFFDVCSGPLRSCLIRLMDNPALDLTTEALV